MLHGRDRGDDVRFVGSTREELSADFVKQIDSYSAAHPRKVRGKPGKAEQRSRRSRNPLKVVVMESDEPMPKAQFQAWLETLARSILETEREGRSSRGT